MAGKSSQAIMLERFGVTIDWRGATLQAIEAIARKSDDSGYGYLWIPEAWGLEAFSTIGHLLGVTRKIKIGTGVINIYSRSAATIAMGAATLNQLAPGRFLLGLGTSGRGLIEKWHGLKFERSLEREREYIEAIRQILNGRALDYEGNILRLKRFRLFTAPPANEIEMYLGAMGKKNLELASNIASGAIVTLYPISKLEEYARFMDGRGKKKLFAYLPMRIVRSEAEAGIARTELSRYVAFYIGSMGRYYAQNLSNLGFGNKVEEVLKASQAGGIREASKAIDEEFLNEFCLIGSPEEVLERASKLSNKVYPVLGLAASSMEEAHASSKWIEDIAASTETLSF